MAPRCPGPALPSLHRRALLRVGGGLAISALAGPRVTADNRPVPTTGRARSCILIHLLGGPPHQDMWDLKPEAPAEIRGPFRPIATSVPGLQICEHLPQLARMADQYTLIRSVSHPNHNHTPMIYYSLTGRPVERPLIDNDVRPPLRDDFPHIGAIASRFKAAPAGLPGFVAIPDVAVRSSTEGPFKRVRERLRGGGAGFLGPLHDPLAVDGDPGTSGSVPALERPADVLADRLERRRALLALLEPGAIPSFGPAAFDDLRRQAVALTGASGGPAAAFSVEGEAPSLRQRYGDHRFGRALFVARKLAEAGVPMIAVHFNEMTLCDGWDTHANNFAALKDELLPMLDQGLSALLEDLSARGLIDQTLVACFGEFGRTPRINKDAGRDHWGSCQTAFLAGGGVQRGLVVGASDRMAAYPTTDPIDPTDLHATMLHCLGLNPASTMHDPLGRPFPLSAGRVIEEVLDTTALG